MPVWSHWGALVTGGSTALGAPAAAPVVGTFNPVSVTFVSLSTGWALGGAPCARSDNCLAFRETLDGGRTWWPRPLPVALVKAADRKVGAYPAFTLSQCCDGALNIRFADQRDGWIYGGLLVPGQVPSTVSIGPDLWSTHNAGLTWQPVHPFRTLAAERPIFDVEAAGGRVYAMAANGSDGAAIGSSPVATNNWRVANSVTLAGPAGGAQPAGAIVLQGTGGWSVYGNDRQRTAQYKRPVGQLVPPVLFGRARFRDPRRFHKGQLGRSVCHGRFRRRPVQQRAPGGDAGVELALLL